VSTAWAADDSSGDTALPSDSIHSHDEGQNYGGPRLCPQLPVTSPRSPEVFDIVAEDTLKDLYGLHDFADDIHNVTVAFMQLSHSLERSELGPCVSLDVHPEFDYDAPCEFNTADSVPAAALCLQVRTWAHKLDIEIYVSAEQMDDEDGDCSCFMDLPSRYASRYFSGGTLEINSISEYLDLHGLSYRSILQASANG